MCKKGDIIVVDKYKHNESIISRHSFIVLDDCRGEIRGVDYDFISLVMSSFKDEQQKAKKLSYPANFSISHEDEDVQLGNTKDGYIKADQFYYFSKDNISYAVIGNLLPEVFNELVAFIEKLVINNNVEFVQITDNLKQ